MVGPFDPNIMPVKITIRYDDIAEQWKVVGSRYVAQGTGGRRYERLRQSFESYDAALTAISHFIGND